MTPRLSVVIPVFNEAGNIGPLIREVSHVLEANGRGFELIIVNDGSTDGTAEEIARAIASIGHGRELRLAQRSGQAAALLAGLRAAQGEVLVTLDGDGQNDPADIPRLLSLVEAGEVDVACGWRVNRHDGRCRTWMSRVANSVRRVVLRDAVHDAGCQLRVFRAEVRSALHEMELMQSFLPALATAAGFRVGELPVRHHARQHGTSKYGLFRLCWRPAAAMLALKWRIHHGECQRH